ncbi:biotin--[acetyl-CoA-carboxylase] ligase [Microbacterium xanthum]|uniref:biotin--[acetyl-CoA-carboxylase] ligase n=1 Tax=Microbacterium xanthum TaxID=3079794 RepID=UPI002AD595D9|nr:MULTISPECIES: biotin--[acetyl-CoA-carboxylase] ligase [unclassified Microbacterium]MDZ8171035.1 biotin--[acetyl-CoA-carboxylase] ligase [Microbacterium sp. KSW-48]MDZ8201552.1 biotin--[acetyl-CoA-carboxylase] ligase [Microbacterium sp. SSW1-59]
MTIPAAGYPRTAELSPRVQVTESTDSTNADVIAGVRDAPGLWPHLSMLVTTDQRAGRGRLDRSWVAPPGTALAVSTLVRVPDLPVAARGWIPLAAGAALVRAVRAQLGSSGHEATLKWPNDVLLDGAKLCGILTEVVPSHPDCVVIGTGINTRMSRAELPVETATSFLSAGIDVDDDRLLADYLDALDRHLSGLVTAAGDASVSGLHADVVRCCATVGKQVTVALPNGEALAGEASGIDVEGRLVVDAGGDPIAVSAGDVVHVR